MYPADLRPRIVRAEGWWLYGEDGQQYADAISSWWVNIHGHAHPRLVEALSRQAGQMDQVMFSGFTHRPAEELADWLCTHYAGMGKLFFSDDGSTAVEVALKMALHTHYAQGSPRYKILALEGAYHGDTFGAMSAAGKDEFNKPYSPLFFKVEHLRISPALGVDEALSDLEESELQRAEELLSTRTVAALIFEPLLQGASGMRLVKKAYLNALAALCDRYGTLLIADEVLAGFYRTGTLFACEQLDFKPDLVCLSKGLTGGFIPLGVTLATDSIYQLVNSKDVRGRFLHGHSFSANPIACAVALESCRMIEEAEAADKRAQVFGWLHQQKGSLAGHPAVEGLRQHGGLLAFELVLSEGAGYFSQVREQAYRFFIENGVLVRPLGRTVYLLPPHCPDEEAQARVAEKIVDFCDSLSR